MSNEIDLQELAIDRQQTPAIKVRRHILTRYVLPATLLLSFLALMSWVARDLVFPPTPVKVVPVLSTESHVSEEGTPLFRAAGWIEPRPTTIRVAALAPGFVEELLVVEDQAVKEGQAIAELVKDDARLEHERVNADLELRKAELAEADATFQAAVVRYDKPVHLQAELGEAEASLAKLETMLKNLPFQTRRAEAELDVAKKVFDRKQEAKRVIADVEIDLAKSEMDAAKALAEELRDRSKSLKKEHAALILRRDALQAKLRLLADETRERNEAAARVKAAKARVELARVAVGKARLQLERMTIKAPVEGRIYHLVAQPGTRVGMGMLRTAGHDSSTIVTMYRPDFLQVRVDVRFEDVPKVALNQLVEIDNPALAQPLKGNVLFVSSEADIQKNTLEVKVAIVDPPVIFKPEMLVDVTFLSPHQQNADRKSTKLSLYVLKELIHHGADGNPFVWLADQSRGIARKTEIEVGSSLANGLVEVKSGLAESSRLVVGDSDSLVNGQRIIVSGEEPLLGSNSRLEQNEN